MTRAKRAGLLRNAALLLGTRRVEEAVDALVERLDDLEEDPQVRAAAAWALGRIGTQAALGALDRHHDDADASVAEAVRNAFEAARAIRDGGGPGDAGEPPGIPLPPAVVAARPSRQDDPGTPALESATRP